MPVVNVGNLEHPSYLPLDVCEVVPGQGFGGDPATSQRQAMIKVSCRKPPENYESITTDGLNIMGITAGKTVERGIKVLPDMVTVPARILNTPVLKYGTHKTTPRFGSWNLANTKFCSGATIPTPAVLWLRKGRDLFETPNMCVEKFTKKLREHGMKVSDPTMYLQASLSGGPESEPKNREAIKQLFIKLLNEKVKFAVVILSDANSKVFDWIKYSGDIKTGIITHCMQVDKLKKGDDQYLSNNAMKVNLKFGGANQVLDGSHSKFIGQGKTMVVGLDVTHPTGTDPPSWPSVAAIVASIDGRMAQWPGEIMIQGRRVEHVEVLQQLMYRRLELWKTHNGGTLPMNILVYRDGVSEGQFDMVLNFELPLVKKACAELYNRSMPYITIVVCGKRHNVRFYPTVEKDQDRTQNPINGCVVDRVVTRPIFWDFYLQAQAPLQGSARPAHYIVIHDDIFRNPKTNPEGKPADMIQELTHNICYMMGRATRSISYATPAFLADKMCDRARKYMLAYYYAFMQPRGPGSDGKMPPPPPDCVQLEKSIVSKMAYI